MRRALDGRRLIVLPGGGAMRLADVLAAAGLALAVVVLGAASLNVGGTALDIGTILRGLSGGALPADQAFALFEVRLPRLALALLAGACVALSGALLQGLVQNPLADPGILGLSQGAMLVVLLMLIFAPATPAQGLGPAALAGGAGVAVCLRGLGGGGAAGLGVLLLGIGVESVLSSVSTLLLVYTPPEASLQMGQWMAGSLFRASPEAVRALLPWALAAIPAVIILGPGLRALDLGEDRARTLGVRVGLLRPGVLGAAVLLSSAAILWVGPLSFLGIMAPQLAGALTGASGRARLVLSALTGGLLVVAADLLARLADPGIAVPIGLALSVTGVPFFLVVLRLKTAARAHI